MGTNLHSSFSPDIQAVFEHIAAAVHAHWSEGRIHDGWTYGAVRSDERKQTPCLVPYEALPEEEKDYDRNTARCVIQTLQKLGFSIERRHIDGNDSEERN